MSPFEYVVGIHSIVLGLAAANVLSAIAESVKHRKRIQHYWVYHAWCVYFLFNLAAIWFYIWQVECGIESRSIFEFSLTFQWTIFIYIASRLLTPDMQDELAAQRKDYFFSIKTPFFVCMAAPFCLYSLGSYVSTGTLMEPILLVSVLLILATYVAGMFSDNSRIQIAVLLLIIGVHTLQEAYQPGIMNAACG
jgi:hypothetical protein